LAFVKRPIFGGKVIGGKVIVQATHHKNNGSGEFCPWSLRKRP
jgi:hypothetical protein